MPAQPPSHKTYNRRYNAHTRELAKLAAAPNPAPKQPAHLTMTDAEIDHAYFNFGKADRKRMKKEAQAHRDRIAAQAAIKE